MKFPQATKRTGEAVSLSLKRSHWISIGLLCGTLIACTPSANCQTTLAQVTGRTPAEKVADLAWKALVKECVVPQASARSIFFLEVVTSGPGEAYVHEVLWEFRGAVISPLQPDSRSEADRLNDEQRGVQWRGAAYMKASAHRSISHFGRAYEKANGNWSPWADGGGLQMSLVKKNNKWNLRAEPTLSDATGLPTPVGDDNVDGGPLDSMSCATATSRDPFGDLNHAPYNDPDQKFRNRQQDAQQQQRLKAAERELAQSREGQAENRYVVGQFICPGMVLMTSKATLHTVTHPAKIIYIRKISANDPQVALRFSLRLDGNPETFSISPERDVKQQPTNSCPANPPDGKH